MTYMQRLTSYGPTRQMTGNKYAHCVFEDEDMSDVKYKLRIEKLLKSFYLEAVASSAYFIQSLDYFVGKI